VLAGLGLVPAVAAQPASPAVTVAIRALERDGANQVGHRYAGPGARVPRISPPSFIHVEAIASGWYLFKTV
jgi:hypothetical protein